MTALPKTLKKVRAEIERCKDKRITEEDTKSALINPVLIALGWKVGNLKEVSQEYRAGGNPVDYALFASGKPKLLVEAKALRERLDDRKWANEFMVYACNAGVRWMVLTNGDEYRVYNACVDVPFEEKLVLSVRLSDGSPSAATALRVLSKHGISRLEGLWNDSFADGQVRKIIEGLLGSRPDATLLKLADVKKVIMKRVRDATPTLKRKDLLTSLRRVGRRLDNYVEADLRPARQSRIREEATDRSLAAKKAWETRRRTTESSRRVSLLDLIKAGFLNPPLTLTWTYKGTELQAELLPDGQLNLDGRTYGSPSAAAGAARNTVTGCISNTDGWHSWRYRDEKTADLVVLDHARKAFLRARPTEP
jgi:hypothetical protein